MSWVQIPSPALAGFVRPSYDWQSRFSGRPNETERTAGIVAAVAQLVEHLLGKEEVMGSSPISSLL